jgi:alpha-methylacyl-CoA racemase
MGPLAGVKVVEIGGIGPGPFAGMVLADLGADVILVERKSVNPNAAELDLYAKDNVDLVRRGKRSIALDLKDPDDREVVLSLVANADLLIEGFRPGVLERLGLGPDDCLARNRKLVYGRMTGWGQTGPLAKAAGHDLNYLAITGAVHYCGLSGDSPYPTPTVQGDVGGGALTLVVGLLSAHLHAVRTGEGQVVDAAICDGAIYNLTLLATVKAQGVLGEERGGDFFTGGAHWGQTYVCADGRYVTVQALEPAFYQELIRLCGLQDDPAFAHQHDQANWPTAKAKMVELFSSKTQAQWCELLEGTDACFAPVLSLSEAAEHPHNVARGNFVDVDGLIQPAPAPKFSVTQQKIGATPTPGQHGQEIRQQLRQSTRA